MNVQTGDMAVITVGLGPDNENLGLIVTVGAFAPKGTEVEIAGITAHCGSPSWWCTSKQPFIIPVVNESGGRRNIEHNAPIPVPDQVLKRIAPPPSEETTMKEDELCTQ